LEIFFGEFSMDIFPSELSLKGALSRTGLLSRLSSLGKFIQAQLSGKNLQNSN